MCFSKIISNIAEIITLSKVFVSESDSDRDSEPDSPDTKSDSRVPKPDSPVPKSKSPVPKQDSPRPNKSGHLVNGHWEKKIHKKKKKPGYYKRLKNWAKKRARGMIK